MFSVVNYFMFFFHVIIGFFDSISRIFLGAGIGILTHPGKLKQPARHYKTEMF
jgi:hypothetical protein